MNHLKLFEEFTDKFPEYEYGIINESKWNWIILFGGLTLGRLIYKNHTVGNNHRFENVVDMLNAEENVYTSPIVDEAKKDVIKKILGDGNIKNQEYLISKINECKIIKAPKELISDKMIAAYTYWEGVDYIMVNDEVYNKTTYLGFQKNSDEMKLNSIRHEFFHLIDQHRLISEKPNIEIDTNMTTQQISNDLCYVFNKPEMVGKTNYFTDQDKEYLTDEKEIYSRFNNLKYYLYRYGHIKTPSSDISEKIWNDIFSGKFVKILKDGEKWDEFDEFCDSDFIEILPLIKKSKISELNKLAYIPITDNNNIT